MFFKFLFLAIIIFPLSIQSSEPKNIFKSIFDLYGSKFKGTGFSMKIIPNSREHPTGGIVIVDDKGLMDDSVMDNRYVYNFELGSYGEEYSNAVTKMKLIETWMKCRRGEKKWIRASGGNCP